ncbi:Hypothetical predicted protein [Paramuricea clavata]|uniref:Uncharacterized protein n=1 Tax=Paramuricea clavata TaxID=317549 RepID=A0A7D9HD29_PARCT|nr:Hypothetical predicted protein [Paramuricea clavata]
MRAIVLLFRKRTITDSEEYIFPSFERVKVTIEGKTNAVYIQGLTTGNFYDKSKRLFGIANNTGNDNISVRKFYKDKFALVVDLRAVDDSHVVGSGKKLLGDNPGILLEIGTDGMTEDILCNIFVLCDGLINISEKTLQEPETPVASDLRENVLKLVDADYERQRLENTNRQLADVIITKFSELMEALDAVKDADGMKKELEGNDLLKKDIKNLVSYVTPYIALIGILSGGITGREAGAIIMGVNAIPFGPPIGVVVFLTVPEDVTLGEINNFTLDGPEFGINLGRPDDFAESWVFSIPSLRARYYAMGNLFRIRWKDRSVMPAEYENSLAVSGIDAL